MSLGICDWQPCEKRADVTVHGRFVCREHETDELRRIVIEVLPELQLDQNGKPCDRRWLNCFARLVDKQSVDWSHALTKAKVQERANHFAFDGATVDFAIKRHPVGRVTEQTWRLDVKSGHPQLLGEHLISTEYAQSADGNYLCPECGGDLDTSPGRIWCSSCNFEQLHDHSL